jgi:solute carrier family 23 (nucleobase transporter), member 1
MIDPQKMVYTLDEIPKPFPKALGLGIQHVLTMFGATIAVPLLLGPIMGFSPEQVGILVASVMLCSGVATFFQVNFGTRLPIIQGVSFSFLGPFFGIIGATAAMGPAVTMQHIAGAIMLGSLVEMLVGFTGLIGKLQKFVSPVVIGPVIALIGLSLFQIGAPYAGANWILSGLVIVGAFVFALIIGPKKPFFSLFPILMAVVVAYVVALLMGKVDFGIVQTAPWFRLPWGEGGWFFPWGLPKFEVGFFLVVLAGYLASIIESYGDYHAINAAAQGPPLTDKQVSRGIGMEGLGCFVTSILGGFASTSYTENIGLVGLTKVASRYVVNVGVVVLVILGIFGKFGAVVATIPGPIVGGLYCTLFGLIASIGLSNSAKADLSSMRNQLIMGFILFMGLSVPAYFNGVPGLGIDPANISFPGAVWLEGIITTIGTTGMAVAAILGLILDNIIPGTREERGQLTYGENKSVSA